MSIRIYALAKKLEIDNKVLMDICAEIGVSIKGSSALASLAEDDVEKIQRYIKESASKKPSAPVQEVSFLAPEPPKKVYGKIPTLPASRTKKTPASSISDDLSEKVSAKEVAEELPKEVAEASEKSAPEISEKRGGGDSGKEEADTLEKADVPAEVQDEPAFSVELSQEKLAGDVKAGGKEAESDGKAQREPDSVKASGENEDTSGASVAETKRGRPAKSGKKGGERAGKAPEKGSSVRSTPLGTRLSGRGGKPEEAPEEESAPRQSVTQRIAAQARLDVPVRPDIKTVGEMKNFPALQTARNIRRDDTEPGGRSSNKTDQKSHHPSLRLAPLPNAKLPVKKRKEPAAQQPVIRLTPEILSGSHVADPKAFVEKVELEERSKREERSKSAGGASERPGRGERGGRAAGDKKRRGEPAVPVVPDVVPVKMGKKGGKAKTQKHTENTFSEEGRDSRFVKQRRSRQLDVTDEMESRTVRWRKPKKQGTSTAAPRKNNYILHLPLTVRSFSDELGLQASKVQGKLLTMGVPATINDALDEDVAQLLADEFGLPVDIRPEVSLEEKLIGEFEKEEEEDPANLVPRPPVVTFLGHVDHGKTSLLDRIIGINVVSGEKGGITQHIRAYNVKRNDRSITFVDTPGHEAFTEMRARGANCTDIAVIVVAADDGVMPQTEEAISHARAAGVPIIVALNKIDLPGVNEPKILQELASNDLLPAEWGGDVEVVRCSALTGAGMEELLDTMLTISEIHEYKANPQKAASGMCLESSVQPGHGVVAKLLVQNGSLHPGDVVVCGETSGRVRVMFDTLKSAKKYHVAEPGIPVNVVGLDAAPGAGDKFYVVSDIADARRLAELRAQEARQKSLAGSAKNHVTLEGFFDKLGGTEVQMLNVILRADVRGSIEAIRKELTKLHHDEVQIHILQATVGGITEADVQLADAADAIIVGFNVVPDENARSLAEQKGVQVRRYDIIYQLTADIKAALEGMLRPEEREKELGRALVQKAFNISRVGTVAGCRVLAGTIHRDCRVRIIRDNRIIGDYAMDTLKRERDDVKEVREGYECGIKLVGFNDIKEGDVLEAYQIESVARTF
ncbi:MAG: translation initiation factor IF-2 [Planctomycetia bacterium]|nr:translation initiation factor IF-2 [Planctomycetia bacterium]